MKLNQKLTERRRCNLKWFLQIFKQKILVGNKITKKNWSSEIRLSMDAECPYFLLKLIFEPFPKCETSELDRIFRQNKSISKKIIYSQNNRCPMLVSK